MITAFIIGTLFGAPAVAAASDTPPNAGEFNPNDDSNWFGMDGKIYYPKDTPRDLDRAMSALGRFNGSYAVPKSN